MKNFGTSLMKLSGLSDPVSMVTDQGAPLPWPILIASSLSKHGKKREKYENIQGVPQKVRLF